MRHTRYGLLILLLVLVLSCAFSLLACSNDVDDSESGADVLKIRIENLPEKSVYSGDLIDLTDASIIATTRDGTVLSVPITQEMISGYDANKLGEQTVTITYKGCTTTFKVEVLKAEVQAISIAERPVEISVVQGGDLSLNGVKLKVELQSRFIILDNLNTSMLRGYDKTLGVGTHTVYIDYAGFSTGLEIVVKEKTTSSIKIVTKPKKLQYFVGDEFNAQGLSVLRKFNNGTEDIITYEQNSALFRFELDFSRESSRSVVKVIVDERFDTFNDCVVKNPVVTKFEIIKEPISKPIYLGDTDRELMPAVDLFKMVEGSIIDWAMGSALVTYDNGDKKEVSLSDPSVYRFYDSPNGVHLDNKEHVFTELNEHVVYLRYGNSGIYAPLHIRLRAKAPIELILGDTRVEGERIEDRIFVDGSRLSTDFLRYNLLYDNGTYESDLNNVNEWESLQENMLADDGSTFDLSISKLDEEDGKQHVNFTYSGVSAGYKIKVVAKTAQSITIKAPYRNVYALGSSLEYDGSYVYVQYIDNSFERIAPIPEESVTLLDSDSNVVSVMSQIGEYTAKVTFAGLEGEFKVSAVDSADFVTNVTLTERKEIDNGNGTIVPTFIAMSFDEVYQYANYEAIPFDNIFMNVTRGTTTTMVAIDDAEIIECNRYVSGEQTILFRYEGFTFGLNVDLVGRKVSSIEISKAPEKLVYLLGEDVELDITGLLITKVFNNGDRGEQNYFDNQWSFDGYDLNEAGVQNVIVTYAIKDRLYTTSFEIEVTESQIVGIYFDEFQTGVETFEIVGENNEIETFRGIKVTYRDDANLTYVNNYFDNEGILVTEISTLYFEIEYADGELVRRELKASYISYDKNINPSVSGDFKRVAKINYGGQSATINLYVSTRKLESIEVYSLPSVTTYAEGQSLNRTGGYLLRTYDDGTTDVLPMTNGLIGVVGYEVNPFENVYGGDYKDQVVTLSYGTKTTNFIVRTYRKLSAIIALSIGNSIFSYGDTSVPVISIRESIAGFTVPTTSLEYLMNGSWVTERPTYPGSYPLRITINENEYYEGDVIEGEKYNLLINAKTIIVNVSELSKVYNESDPTLSYVIEEGELVGNDIVELELTREAGENVGFYRITAKLIEGGANDNRYYTIAYDPVGLTINPKVVTVNDRGTIINVEFDPPSDYNAVTHTIAYTGMPIFGFGARYRDAKGFISYIDAKDILYYDSNNNLLTELPKERGTYKVVISNNYSFQGVYERVFTIS